MLSKFQPSDMGLRKVEILEFPIPVLPKFTLSQSEPRLLSRYPLPYQSTGLNLDKMAYQASMVSKYELCLNQTKHPSLASFEEINKNFSDGLPRRTRNGLFTLSFCAFLAIL